MGVWYLGFSRFVVLEFGWIELYRHTAGSLVPEFRCLENFELNYHGSMSEERNKLSLGLHEFRRRKTLVWQYRKRGGWAIKMVLASRPTRRTCMTSTGIDIAIWCPGSSWYVGLDAYESGGWYCSLLFLVNGFFSWASLGLDTTIRFFDLRFIPSASCEPGSQAAAPREHVAWPEFPPVLRSLPHCRRILDGRVTKIVPLCPEM